MTDLSDEAIEAFFLGRAHGAWEHDEALVNLADQVAIGTTGPPPPPSRDLLAFLGEPFPASATPHEEARPLAATSPWRRRTLEARADPTDRGNNVIPLFRRLRLTVGAAAVGVAAAALVVAGTAGVLPEPAMRAVSWVVEAVTPFELREPARTVTGGDHVPQQPTTTVAPGPVGGPGHVGQGEAPRQPGATTPATPPTSIPARVPGSVQPPSVGAEQGGSNQEGPITAPAPAPAPGFFPSPGGDGRTPPTTVVDRPGQSAGGTAARDLGGSPAPRY